jgi:nucleotide-binding universal stress UspA family protein
MIPKIQKILYTTDLTKNSAYVFRYAVNSARKHDAVIHILHVVDSRPLTEAYLQIHPASAQLAEVRRETTQELVGKIQDRLREFARRELKDDPETLRRVASIQVVFGDPAEEILNAAQAMPYDVLIMGNHGKGILRHAFLGSVAEKVLQRSETPVYIIPIPKGDTDIALGEI